jgi:PhnB protein
MARKESTKAATPMLAVHDAAAALEFYKKAFGSEEVGERYPYEGKIGHAEFKVEGALVMLADEFPEHNKSPRTLGGTPVIIHVQTEDVDRVVERATAAGGKLTRPVSDNPYGRIARILDPFGHMWMFNGPVKEKAKPGARRGAKTPKGKKR